MSLEATLLAIWKRTCIRGQKHQSSCALKASSSEQRWHNCFQTSYIAASHIKNVPKKYNIHVIPNEHDQIGIFLQKNNIELCSEINTIIEELQYNGFLEGLMKKWNL